MSAISFSHTLQNHSLPQHEPLEEHATVAGHCNFKVSWKSNSLQHQTWRRPYLKGDILERT
jgi:hypothetical protein